MAKKITQKEMYTAIISFINGADTDVSTDEMVTFLKDRIEILNKKTANRKPTGAQQKTIELMPIVLEVLTDEGQTVSEIQAKDDRISNASGISNQKVTSILKCLVATGKATQVREGKKSLYKLA